MQIQSVSVASVRFQSRAFNAAQTIIRNPETGAYLLVNHPFLQHEGGIRRPSGRVSQPDPLALGRMYDNLRKLWPYLGNAQQVVWDRLQEVQRTYIEGVSLMDPGSI